MSRRTLTIAVLVLLLLAVGLELSGIAPGLGLQTLPFLVLLLAALFLWRSVWPQRSAAATSELDVPLAGVHAARLETTFGSGSFTLDTESPDDVLLAGAFGGPARPRVTTEDAVTAIRLTQPLSLVRRRSDWRLALSPAVSWELIALRLGASEARLDLRGLDVRQASIEAGGTTLTVDLPAAGAVTLQTSGGKATLRVPSGASIVIHSEIRLGQVIVNEAHFQPEESGMDWQAGDVLPGEPVLYLTLKGGLGTVEVQPV